MGTNLKLVQDPMMKPVRRWFLTPTGDYYTVTPISLAKAQELIEAGVRNIIMPTDIAQRDDYWEVAQLLQSSGVGVRYCPTKDIPLTGS